MYNFADDIPKMHFGYHYASTAIEWKYLLDAVKDFQTGKPFLPQVSLSDGYSAVEMGIAAMNNISNACDGSQSKILPVTAYGSKSSENLLDIALNTSRVNSDHAKEAFMRVIDACDGEYKVNLA